VPAALDDEIADHAVKERVGVVALAYIAQEVRDRERRALRIELDDELTHAGRHAYPRRIRGERGSEVQSEKRRREPAPRVVLHCRILQQPR
jgi:hypothetical protein